MRKIVCFYASVLVLALLLTGCGSSSDGSSSRSSSGGGASATITLPDGWAMSDAIGADEVGAITGKTMQAFPEASSAAQDGRPAGSFTATGIEGSKIYFGVDVQAGESGYESMLSFAESGSATDVSGVGDQAAVATFSDGRAGIVVRSKGDAVIRVDWDPKVYTQDHADFGTRLANALLQNMYQ